MARMKRISFAACGAVALCGCTVKLEVALDREAPAVREAPEPAYGWPLERPAVRVPAPTMGRPLEPQDEALEVPAAIDVTPGPGRATTYRSTWPRPDVSR